MTICVITVDRLLVLRFPLHRDRHLTPRSAAVLCVLTWLVGLILALIPVFYTPWQFYRSVVDVYCLLVVCCVY